MTTALPSPEGSAVAESSLYPGKGSKVGGRVAIKGAVAGFLCLLNIFRKIQNELGQKTTATIAPYTIK